MDILSLDLSTKTGWAFFSDNKLVKVGTFTHKVVDYKSEIKIWTDIPKAYPYNILNMAQTVAEACVQLWFQLGQPYIVVEHTEGSSHRISQRTLEWIHYAVYNRLHNYALVSGVDKFKYVLNSDWRKATNCYISQWPEMQKFNKEVAKAKKKATPNKAGARVAKIDGKIVSKWDAKKLSIYIAKKNYPDMADQITTDDIADAINMGHAAIKLGIFNAS
jgi:hypothetical protein